MCHQNNKLRLGLCFSSFDAIQRYSFLTILLVVYKNKNQFCCVYVVFIPDERKKSDSCKYDLFLFSEFLFFHIVKTIIRCNIFVFVFFFVFIYSFCLWFYGNATALAVNSENACSRQCFNSAYVTIKMDCSSLDTSCTWDQIRRNRFIRLILFNRKIFLNECFVPFLICLRPIYSGIEWCARDPTMVFHHHSPNEINSPWTV